MTSQRRPKCPWMKFYPTDFLGDKDVAVMSVDEIGAYCLLLFYSWQEDPRGTLPMCDRTLSRMARMTKEQWQEAKPIVLAPFKQCEDDPDRIYQPRMVDEASNAEAKRTALSEAGKRGALKRWGGNKPPDGEASGEVNGEAMAYQKPEARSQSQTQIDSPSSSERYVNEPDVQKAWNALPNHKRRGLGGFRDAWIMHVVRPEVDPAVVIESIKEYCASPEGQGKFARGATRLLTDNIWDEDRSAWNGQVEVKAPDALDAILSEAGNE